MIKMNITIIIPSRGKKDNSSLIKKLKKTTKHKLKFIVIPGKGIAEAYNQGIKMAKESDIIITFHEDCYPATKNFISKLIKPLEKENVVATTAKVVDYYSKKEYTPLLDGKATAYKRKALEKAGLFDEKTFKTAGEDYDIYMKLKKIGDIEYPDCKIIHKHKNHKNKTKTKQIASANGVLFRKYFFKKKDWYKSMVCANPFNYDYFIEYWKGFFTKTKINKFEKT